MNVAEPFLEVLRTEASRTALHEPGGRTISFGEIGRHVSSFAAWLANQGMGPGHRTVIQVPAGIEFTVAVLAVLLVGGVAVLCEAGLGDTVYLSRIRATRARWLLVYPLLVKVDRLPGVRRLLRRVDIDVPPAPPLEKGGRKVVLSRGFLDNLSRAKWGDGDFAPVPRDEKDDGVIIFTGGTTSRPKGVRLSHGALAHYLANIATLIEDLPIGNFLADTPQQVLYGLRLGRTVHITKGRKRSRARHVLRLLSQGSVDAYFSSPYIWMEMMDLVGENVPPFPAALKLVLLGGAPVTSHFLKMLKKRLSPDTRVMIVYGMTEAGPVCSATLEQKLAWNDGGDFVGSPLPGIAVTIDGSGDRGTGEVLVRGPSLYSGYLGEARRPAETPLYTGDVGRLVQSEHGVQLVLLGRKKDMIIRGGVNIYPGTLESSIKSLVDHKGGPLLRECALIGLWNEKRQDEEVILCYQPAGHGGSIDPRSLRRKVEKLTGVERRPDRYLEVAPIPVTGRQNKVDKRELRRRAAAAFGLRDRSERFSG